MTIIAKYASICPCCSVRIIPGSRVQWSKGSQARHATCVQGATVQGATVTTVAYRDRRYAQRYTHCEGWGADNPHAPRDGHCADCAADCG